MKPGNTASITNSAAGDWRSCRRLYQYRQELAIEPIGREDAWALRFGTLYHGGLEVWFSTGDLAAVKSYLQGQCDGIRHGDEESLIAYHTARIMIEGYVQRWADVDRHIAFSLPEQQFDVPVRNPATGRPSRRFRFRGKLDLPVLYQDGTIRLMEHKTAGSIDGPYLERLWADTQITGYVAAMRDIGLDVREVVYDVAIKPTIRRGREETVEDYVRRLSWLYVLGMSPGRLKQRKSETMDEFADRVMADGTPVDLYHREIVVIGDRQIEEWRADLWDTTQEILWARQHNRFPRNTKRCFDWGRVCAYAPICQSLGSEDLIIQTEYQQRELHPELDGDNETTPF